MKNPPISINDEIIAKMRGKEFLDKNDLLIVSTATPTEVRHNMMMKHLCIIIMNFVCMIEIPYQCHNKDKEPEAKKRARIYPS